jgi:hypothetical protein
MTRPNRLPAPLPPILLETQRLRFRPEEASADDVDWLNDPAVNSSLEKLFSVWHEASVRAFVEGQVANS